MHIYHNVYAKHDIMLSFGFFVYRYSNIVFCIVWLMFCRQELSETQEELLEVKSSYVNICNEKDEIEAKLEREWSNKLDQQINKVTIDPNIDTITGAE